MAKQLSATITVYINTINMLMQQVAELERRFEGNVIISRDMYEELLVNTEELHDLKRTALRYRKDG